MTTDSPPTGVPVPPRITTGPGERLQRRQRRRRLVKEEMLAVLVLLALLAATVAVLATQWLANGPSVNAGPSPASVHTYTGGT